MTIDKKFKEEIKGSKEKAGKLLEGFGGEIGRKVNYHDILVVVYKKFFLSKGEDFTRGYLEGRNGRFSNLFSDVY